MTVTQPPAIPSLTIAGRVFTDMENLIVLLAPHDAAGTNRYSGARKVNTTAAYQVTAGKTLYIVAMRCFVNNASSALVSPLYGDTDVGIDSAAAPTNSVFYCGNATGGRSLTTPSGLGLTAESAVDFRVPAAKYVHSFMAPSCAGTVFFYGYER